MHSCAYFINAKQNSTEMSICTVVPEAGMLAIGQEQPACRSEDSSLTG
jgi:hypothetical protein